MVLLLTYGISLLAAVLVSKRAERTVLSTAVLFLFAGLGVGSLAGAPSPSTVEVLARLALLSAILLLGALLSFSFLAEVPASGWLFAATTLLLVRPAAIAIALLGSRLSWRERNRVTLIENGAIFEALGEAVRLARTSVHVLVYMWRPGPESEAIRERCCAGVRCRVLVDPVGSEQILGPGDSRQGPEQQLRAAGCEVRSFRPLAHRLLRRLVGRNHQKLAVIDGARGLHWRVRDLAGVEQ